MEQELFEGLHKNRRWALEAVCQENLCRSWYLSYQLAGDAAGAASLLLSAWREALAALKNAREAPGEDFQGLLSEKILAQYQQGVQPDTRFENLPPPKVGKSYQYLVGEVKRLPAALRPLYWLYAYGGLDASQLAAVTEEDRDTLAQRLSQGEEQLAQRRASWTKPQRAAYVRLSTQFRDPGGYGFQEARLPVSLLHVLWKELGLPVKPPKERPSLDHQAPHCFGHSRGGGLPGSGGSRAGVCPPAVKCLYHLFHTLACRLPAAGLFLRQPTQFDKKAFTLSSPRN